jgi:hypothetical protein
VSQRPHTSPAWRHAGARSRRRRSERLLFVILVTAAAAILRGYHLGASPLWIDEFQTWRNLHPGAGHGLWEQFRDNVQGPLYLLLSWRPGQPASPEWLLRLPAALAGVLAVPVMYKLGSEWRDRSTGAWAALLLALALPRLARAGGARLFLMILLAMAASLQLLRMQRHGASTRGGLTYGLLAGLAVLSNMSALFLVAAHALGMLLLHRPRDGRAWRGWAVAFGLTGLIALPWLLQATGFWYPGRLAAGGGGGLLPEGRTPDAAGRALRPTPSSTAGLADAPELHRPGRLEIVRRLPRWRRARSPPRSRRSRAGGAAGGASNNWGGAFVALVRCPAGREDLHARYLAVTAPSAAAAGHDLSTLHSWTVRWRADCSVTQWSSASCRRSALPRTASVGRGLDREPGRRGQTCVPVVTACPPLTTKSRRCASGDSARSAAARHDGRCIRGSAAPTRPGWSCAATGRSTRATASRSTTWARGRGARDYRVTALRWRRAPAAQEVGRWPRPRTDVFAAAGGYDLIARAVGGARRPIRSVRCSAPGRPAGRRRGLLLMHHFALVLLIGSAHGARSSVSGASACGDASSTATSSAPWSRTLRCARRNSPT